MTSALSAIGDLFGITDHRFEGWSDTELADAIDQLDSGRGAQAMAPSVEALQSISKSMYHIDTTLHEQLQAIGVSWETKQSSELAKTVVAESKRYAGNTHERLAGTADTVQAQANAYARARNAMPDSATLRSSSRPSYLFGGHGTGTMTMHGEQDAARAAEAQRAARDQALDAWNGYSDHSTSSIHAHQPLPQSPPVHVGGPPMVSGTSAAGAGSFPSAGPVVQAGPPAVAGGGAGIGVVSGAPSSQVPGLASGGSAGVGAGPPASQAGAGFSGGPSAGSPTGGGSGAGFLGAGTPDHAGRAGAPGVTGGRAVAGGGPGAGAGPIARGPVSGAGPLPATEVSGAGPVAAGAGARGMSAVAMNEAAMGSAVATGSGAAGIGGAAAEKDRLSAYRGAPGGVVEEDELGRRTTPFGEPEGPAAAAKAASRFAAQPEEGSSILEPATGHKEEDATRVRRYGVDSEDLFHDENLVSRPVLGEDD
ncbi:MAG: hypothetical protein ACRDRN_00955 [Sciscionella sp.]